VLTAHGGPPKIAQNGTPFPFSDWWTLLVVIEKCCRGAAAMSTRAVLMATLHRGRTTHHLLWQRCCSIGLHAPGSHRRNIG
jgi:hypothetical protein